MAPKLRVLVSSPSSAYPPSKVISVNSPTPTAIKTPSFEGEISVWIKNYEGDHKGGEGDEYFGQANRSDMTYAIVIKGKFTEDVDADQVLWGNVFEHPIRDHLPWGTAIATKFMYFVDPNVESDIYADKPWALSPMVASMNYLSVGSSTSPKATTVTEEHTALDDIPADSKARAKHFGDKAHREAVNLKGKEVGMEFCNGLLDFNTLSVQLPPPFKLQIPLTKYWDGQPVTYVCQKRGSPGTEVMFSVAFEIVDEELKKALGDKGVGKGIKSEADVEQKQEQLPEGAKEDKKEEISDDVD